MTTADRSISDIGRSRARAHDRRLRFGWRGRDPGRPQHDCRVRGLSSLASAIAVATPEQIRDLIRMVIERIDVTETEEYEVEPVPAARPFFATHESLSLAPPDGLEPPTQALGRPRSVH